MKEDNIHKIANYLWQVTCTLKPMLGGFLENEQQFQTSLERSVLFQQNFRR